MNERIQILNTILQKRINPSYLEIGYGDGTCFESIACVDKTCVDPSPFCDKNFGKSGTCIKKYSDSFFESNQKMFDVIFIDGDHSYDQVCRDFSNSLKFIKKDGCIVLHDCNPPDKNHTNQNLCGDGGYRMFTEFYQKNTTFTWMTSFEDYGVCVVTPNNFRQAEILNKNGEDLYDTFVNSKINILNLKQASEIIKIINLI